MSKPTLRLLAVMLTVGIIVVIFAGLDGLPRDLRAQIGTERTALAAAQKQLSAARYEVDGDLQSESALFQSIPASQQYADRFSRASDALRLAARKQDELDRLEKKNSRNDRTQVESILADEHRLRTAGLSDASAVQKDAAHWIDLKQHLPQDAQQMERDYRAIHAYDLAALATAIQKAETDWPEKKTDLETRLAADRAIVGNSDQLWQSTTDARRMAAAGDFAHLNIGAFVAATDSLKTGAAELPQKAEELKTLSAQLYDSWDKVLVDLEARGPREKIRTVRIHLTSAATSGGVTTSDEKWVDVSKGQFDANRNNLGMAIEHKPAGKYDVEAERVAQPAGFAYMAPPGQSNQYGHWEERGGGQSFWVFYGQYALMRDLLFNHSYRPYDRYEWEGYRTYQLRGQTYYGRDEAAGQAPKYGTQGTATQKTYEGSSYAKSGGFKDSQYASKPGGYKDSKYASPSMRDPNADHSGQKFGKGSNRPSEPDRGFRPPPSRSAPSFHPPSRSPGRSFGRRR